jgi:hypothetical protein
MVVFPSLEGTMALYVEITRRTKGESAWEELGDAELASDGKTLTNLSIPEDGLGPDTLQAIAKAICLDQIPHPEEPLADQVGTVEVGSHEYGYRTVFANPQVPGG